MRYDDRRPHTSFSGSRASGFLCAAGMPEEKAIVGTARITGRVEKAS
jgi:hypothetical protein